MIRIHRDIEDASHIVVQLIHGGCKSYVYSRKFDTLGALRALRVAVHVAALGMGAEQAETERSLETAIRSCRILTRELEKRLRIIRDDQVLNYETDIDSKLIDKFYELDAIAHEGRMLTHEEIYWLDWFIRKYKLCPT